MSRWCCASSKRSRTPPTPPSASSTPTSAMSRSACGMFPILGGVDAIEHVVGRLAARNERPTTLILADGTEKSRPNRLRLVTAAETLGLSVLRAAPPTMIGKSLDLEVVNLADLLGRPQTLLDDSVVLRALKGRRVMVTGAGGTIGRELVRQIAAVGPAQIILVDCGEFNLYSIELELRENFPQVPCTPLLCSIRQRRHVMAAFDRHRPDFVFHAAALKHVPLVETNICAGRADQRAGHPQHRGCRPPIRRARDGAGLHRQGGEPGRHHGRHQAAWRTLLPGARSRRPRPPVGIALHDGALRQRAGIERIADPAVPAPAQAPCAAHRHPSGHHALLHDRPRGRPARAPQHGARDGMRRAARPDHRARHGRAGEDHGHRPAHDPPVRP